MWAGGGGEATSRRHQRLTGTSKGPKGGAPRDDHCGPWPEISGTKLHVKAEVPSGGKLDVENVERRKTYLGMGRLHIRDDTTGILQVGI